MKLTHKNYIIYILKFCLYPIKKLILKFLKKKNYIILFRASNSLGDNIILTGIIRQLNNVIKKDIILFTNFPEIFENNNRVVKVFSLKKKNFLTIFLKLLEGDEIYEMNQKFEGYNDALDFFRFESNEKKSLFEKKHLAHFISGRLCKVLDFSDFKNEIILSTNEKNEFKNKFKNLDVNKYAIINPHSKSQFTPNKGWGFENFQKLVDISNYTWCQVGEKNDKKLKHVKYYLDISLRELFYLISKSSFILANEGYLNHIASSFNKKTYILKPGIIPNEYFKYNHTISIERDPPIACSPCYLKTPCYKEKRFCMTDIAPERVKNILDN